MAQIIQIKRRIAGTGAPATLAAGEIAAAMPAAGPAEFYIGDGSAVWPLVSSLRQVELAGNQTIAGNKTISGALIGAPTNFQISGGANGQVLKTDGAGALSWANLPASTVIDAVAPATPQSGDLWFDTNTNQLNVWNGTAWVPSTPAPLAITVNAPLSGDGTPGTPLSLVVATGAQVAAGTDDVNPVTSLSLRSQLGADAATLTTTAKTVVPAIIELNTKVNSMTGALQLVGTYDVAGNVVTPDATSPIGAAGPLPASAPANEGWYVIATNSGTGVAPAPAVPIAAGDWLVSTGNAWVLIETHNQALAASNVTVTTIGTQPWTNVQAALEGLNALETAPILVDGTSIVGDGIATPLAVATLDGGTY